MSRSLRHCYASRHNPIASSALCGMIEVYVRTVMQMQQPFVCTHVSFNEIAGESDSEC
jgi:hypothetical protein